MIANLIVNEDDVPSFLRFVESFLGRDGVKQRLAGVDRSLKSCSATVQKCWTVPENAVWIGLRQLRAAPPGFLKDPRESAIARVALEFAAVLQKLAPTLPDWKRSEFRNRLLGKGSVWPVLVEMMTAVHWLIRGFSVESIKDQSVEGRQTPEMIVHWPGGEFEIECKAHGVDTGRKISRRAFFEICDVVISVIDALVPREMEVALRFKAKDKLVFDARMNQSIREMVSGALSANDQAIEGLSLQVVRRRAQEVASEQVALSALQRRGSDFRDAAVFLRASRGRLFQRFLISCESTERDHVLKSVERKLKEASKQLSRRRPARNSLLHS